MAAFFKDSSQLYIDRAHTHKYTRKKKKKHEMNHFFFFFCFFIIPERTNKYDKKEILLVEKRKMSRSFSFVFLIAPKDNCIFMLFIKFLVLFVSDRSNGFGMTSNNIEEDGISLVFDTNVSFVSSTSLNPITTTSTNNTNNNYDPLIGDMLDAELDSDPQMSDSELSWQSVTDVDSLTATNHWRGWKQQTTTPSTTIINTNNSSPPTNSTSICFSSLAISNEGLIKFKNSIHILY